MNWRIFIMETVSFMRGLYLIWMTFSLQNVRSTDCISDSASENYIGRKNLHGPQVAKGSSQHGALNAKFYGCVWPHRYFGYDGDGASPVSGRDFHRIEELGWCADVASLYIPVRCSRHVWKSCQYRKCFPYCIGLRSVRVFNM